MAKLIAMIVAPLALVGIARAQPEPEFPPPDQQPAEQPPACDTLGMRTSQGPAVQPSIDVVPLGQLENGNATVTYEQQVPNLDTSPSSQGMEKATPQAGIEGTQGFGRRSSGELSPGFFDGQPSVRVESPTEYPTGPRDIHAGFGGGAPY
jgi:hypothetical protein